MLSSLQQTLAFLLAPGCGAATYWSVVDYYGSISQALNSDLTALKSDSPAFAVLQDLQVRGTSSGYCSAAERELDRVAALKGVSILLVDSDAYPPLLKEVRRAPPLLYVRGNVGALSLPQIAVVGSRNATTAGRELAFSFSKELSEAGFAITSGLALGIDGAAHKGALAGRGTTIAVMGSGIDLCYPQRHLGLAEAMLDGGGALVSEFSVGTAVLPQNFPQRNRIVSGLACGTLVVEAALKSGSLITARFALEQNREVFAIPGSIKSPVSQGCHSMIKSGAKLVESTKDIVAELGSLLALHDSNVDCTGSANVCYANESGVAGLASPGRTSQTNLPKLGEDQRIVFDVIGFEPISTDTIAAQSKTRVDVMATALLALELQGLIENTGLGYVRV